MGNLSFLIGFGLAPVLFVAFGIGFALIADALSFIVAFAAILGVKAPPSARSVKEGERGNVRREFIGGLRFSFSNVVIRTLLIVMTIVLFGGGAINALFVFFLSQDLHAPRAAIGIFPVVLGLGLVLGSILGSALARRIGLTRIFWIAVILMGIFAVVLSRQTTFALALVFGFLFGVPNGIMNVAIMPLVLHVTPREMVGRIMTVLEPSMMVAQIASVAVFGTLASTVFSNLSVSVLGMTFGTYDLLILIPGLLCLFAGVLALVSFRRVRIVVGRGNATLEAC
jgi:MFS family permease